MPESSQNNFSSSGYIQHSKGYINQQNQNSKVWAIVLSVSVAPIATLILLLFTSQLGGKDIYGTYYNDPLEAERENNKVNHPCIVLQLNRDGSFEQTAYYSNQKVLSLKGNYKNTESGLEFSDFISYNSEVDIKRRKVSSKRFTHEKGYFLADSQHWYNSYSIPSGNDEDNYYVKPRDGRCKSLP